jgi:hypothetical protein
MATAVAGVSGDAGEEGRGEEDDEAEGDAEEGNVEDEDDAEEDEDNEERSADIRLVSLTARYRARAGDPCAPARH